VVNDVFKRLILSLATLYPVAWRRVESSGTVAVSHEWSIVLSLHCSHTVVVCLHALQALTVLSDRTSDRHMMTLTSSVFKTCTRALGTCVPSSTSMAISLFFMLEVRGSQGTVGHVATLKPT
jgi:hypothetical protein